MGTLRRFHGTPAAPRWDGVGLDPYVVDGAEAGTRQVLIGPGDGAENFALRCFTLAPGTTSRFETHAHDHGVYVLHGHGHVLLGDDVHALGPGDVVFVGPHERHAFTANADEPLGFLCVVPARR